MSVPEEKNPDMHRFNSCVTPPGHFVYGIHKPRYTVTTMRPHGAIDQLGHLPDGNLVDNQPNYPTGDVQVDDAGWIFEVANPLPFKGATYISKAWADVNAADPRRIQIPRPRPASMSKALAAAANPSSLFARLPEPVLLALATCSTDPDDLRQLAELSCEIEKNHRNEATGLAYRQGDDGTCHPVIHNHQLFEAVANNVFLPDSYKIAMVIRPGAQGGSEIVGEFQDGEAAHVYEYLRRNSYIADGHYAANMAEDAIRYTMADLCAADIRGLRHLYYQRTFVRLAAELDLPLPATQRQLTEQELEDLRLAIVATLPHRQPVHTATLWGWNFGFDYAPSGYRLHASHQQVHQQYALVPETVTGANGTSEQTPFAIPAFACGDQIADAISHYRLVYDRDFFSDYRTAIVGNTRMDGRTDLPDSLVVWRDERVMLFVPKAQTSQWELQLMTLPESDGRLPGNIIDSDTGVRASLDNALLTAQKAFAGLGARMVTSIEYAKRLGPKGVPGQPLVYVLLPRLPESPGAFSEAQLRFINGHYPEDFAAALRTEIAVAGN
ncbi:MAG: hypothetical protein ACK5PS_09060 [Desulfopila sp.]